MVHPSYILTAAREVHARASARCKLLDNSQFNEFIAWIADKLIKYLYELRTCFLHLIKRKERDYFTSEGVSWTYVSRLDVDLVDNRVVIECTECRSREYICK